MSVDEALIPLILTAAAALAYFVLWLDQWG
jgi:hypothetical protein